MKSWLVSDYRESLYEQRELKLQSHCNMLRNTIITSDYLNSKVSNAVDVELSQLNTMYNARVIIIDAEYRIVKDTYYLDDGKTAFSDNVVAAFSGLKTITTNYEKEYISITLPVKSADTSDVSAVVVSVFSTEDINDILTQLKGRANIMMVVLYVIIVCVGIVICMHITGPMKRMQKAIDKIADTTGTEQILEDGYTYVELSGIARALNHNTTRMKELDNSRQQFVSNVAHELKTPITSIKVLADSLIAQEDIPPELYKEFLQDIVTEIDRESDIINDLLSLVRLDSGKEPIVTAHKDINEILELILKRLKPLAASKNIEMTLESYRPVVAEIDEVKFTIAIQNFVENAIKYNILDGWVRVSLNADHKYFYIKVADSGIGIPQEDLSKIFERFYRVDKARSRETGGTGLGLSIAHNIIKLHRGEVKVFSTEGEGTTFNIRIPLNYAG